MKQLPDKPKQIIDTLKTAGFECFAVGGSVRDLLLDRSNSDWDFTTNASPEQILEVFGENAFYENTFGTVGIKIYRDSRFQIRNSEKQEGKTEEGSEKPEAIYEITTYRTEGSYSDSRHPDTVSWGNTIEEDLARRDFTINAIAYDGSKLVDPYDGQGDLKSKLIRAVGTPDMRFEEDALRMMRAVRIATQLGFLIEEETMSAIQKHSSQLAHIAQERIHDELIKILASEHPADGILLLRNTSLLAITLPELDEAFEVPQKSPKRHHIYDVGTHSVMALKHCPSEDPIVRFATLIHDIGKPQTFKKTSEGVITFYNHEVVGTRIAREICKRLRFSKHNTQKILTMVRWHQFSVDERQTDSAIRRFIRRVGKENLSDMLDLRTGDRLGGGARETSWRLELYKKRIEAVQRQPFTVSDLKISGHDVMTQYGLKPGPEVGSILHQLFSEVEEGTLTNDTDALLRRLNALKQENTDKS